MFVELDSDDQLQTGNYKQSVFVGPAPAGQGRHHGYPPSWPAYMALAAVMGVTLLSGDRRLARVSATRCPIEILAPTR
jgi:hypothetical protein